MSSKLVASFRKESTQVVCELKTSTGKLLAYGKARGQSLALKVAQKQLKSVLKGEYI